MGADAQEQLSVGMGALAGSTIMLLTIPWFLALLAGRVDLVDGEPAYKKPKGVKKLTNESLTAGAISTDAAVPNSCVIMLITCVTYVIIQLPAMGQVRPIVLSKTCP